MIFSVDIAFKPGVTQIAGKFSLCNMSCPVTLKISPGNSLVTDHTLDFLLSDRFILFTVFGVAVFGPAHSEFESFLTEITFQMSGLSGLSLCSDGMSFDVFLQEGICHKPFGTLSAWEYEISFGYFFLQEIFLLLSTVDFLTVTYQISSGNKYPIAKLTLLD